MSRVIVGLNAAILAVSSDRPRLLTIRGGDLDALPFGPFEPDRHRTLELGLRGWVREQTGFEPGYVEQLYTFGDRDREPDSLNDVRLISVAYLALVREEELAAGAWDARWRDVFQFFPWEDWRRGRPAMIAERIVPALASWVDAAPDRALRERRRERSDLAFGLAGATWNGVRVLDRYELLYEAGLVEEARRDAALEDVDEVSLVPGRAMVADHRRILATAIERIRGKLNYRPVVFELLPPSFTLFQLQRVVEALAGIPLHKQNFRRLVEKAGLVEGTGRMDDHTGGRPAELFRFRRDVLRERRAPGVGWPGAKG